MRPLSDVSLSTARGQMISIVEPSGRRKDNHFVFLPRMREYRKESVLKWGIVLGSIQRNGATRAELAPLGSAGKRADGICATQ